MDYTYLNENVRSIKEKITAAALRVGRDAQSVTLMSAVKSADAEEINYIHKVLGIHDVGENRVQQLLERWEKLDREGLRMHFIGSLQTNKVKYIIDKVYMIHSLDSDRLAAEIDRQAAKHGLTANVLVEINSGGEESKGGIAPEEAAEFCLSLAKYKSIRLCGFMTMAPFSEDPEDSRPFFRRLRELRDEMEKRFSVRLPRLSMGMSGDFADAIAEGATLVRVGTALFGPRPPMGAPR